ncbi:GNAT family N-acetyltransferase [Actinomycetospora endophytica]|uniref:GNAT family N-acetyltransferase n=1 Tax=Actinomycetospora endophytica TaxID=2291215 RepID=A0ABS8PL11_9PSEU|nr:GNAT family protein [Actinomycetospora endophytica]MCD2198170.1 GNAT family N-acetyltransferase [Actinomycetospora endophytica]
MSELVAMPRLDDGEIVLRAFERRDVPVVLQAGKDPLIPLITTVPAPGSTDEALDWVDRQHQRLRDGLGYSFCVARALDDRALGQIGVWPHRHGHGRAVIGYWIAPEFRGAGVVTRALRLVSAWGVDHPGVHRLELYVEPWNEGSWRAAERVGFLREGLMRRWEAVGDEPRDMFMYSLLPDDPRG